MTLACGGEPTHDSGMSARVPHPLAGLLNSLLPVRDAAGQELLIAVPDPDNDPGDGLLRATLRLMSHDEGLVRDIKEQTVVIVPANHADHPRLADWLRASFAALPARLADCESLMPMDLFYPELLALPDLDEAGFSKLLADPARLAEISRERDDRERSEAYEAAVGRERAPALLALRRPRYVLRSEPLDEYEDDDDDDDDDENEEDEREEPGTSHLGGSPLLPPDFVWPRFDEDPLLFLGQIDLAALPCLPPGPDADLLPRTGILSLFLANGDPDRARGHGALFYFPDPSALVRTARPRELHEPPFPAHVLTAEVEEPALPGWEQPYYALLLGTFGDPDVCPYSRAIEEIRNIATYGGQWWEEGLAQHQLLGYPEVLQSDALAAAAYDEREHLGVAHPPWNSREHAEQAAQWRLLWQVDSESALMLGDDGMVHVVIREDDLRARRFERARVVFQCH